MSTRPLPTLSVTAACAIAAIALAVAMGIGRFAFTPLLPLMVRDGSLAPSAGVWLAASNYLGYLAGALTASWLGLSLPALMRGSLAGIVVSTAAMGAFDGLAAWGILRFVAGVFSAWTLVSTSAWALQHLAQAGRTVLSGMVYAGVGLGIAFAGLFCLAAARPGVPASQLWLELGVLAALSIVFPSLFVGPAVGDLRPSRFGVAGRPHTWPVHGPRDLLRRARLRLHPAGHVPARSRTRGGGRPADVRPCLAPLRHCSRTVHYRNRSAFRSCQPPSRLGGEPSPHGHRGHPAQPVAHPGDDRDCSAAGRQHLHGRDDDRHAGGPRAGTGQPHGAPRSDDRRVRHRSTGGPLVSGALDLLPVGHRAALGHALQLAAFALALSAAYLWPQSRPASHPLSKGENTVTHSNVRAARQGFGSESAERLPLPARDAMTNTQSAAAEAIIAGPRKAIFGPFVALLQTSGPHGVDRQDRRSAAFRGQPARANPRAGNLRGRPRNQQPVRVANARVKGARCGVAQRAINALAAGARPRGLTADEEAATDLVAELMQRHGVSDRTYDEAIRRFGEPGTVELTALAGYFVMVCWIMNVAHTPGPAGSATVPLGAFPA